VPVFGLRQCLKTAALSTVCLVIALGPVHATTKIAAEASPGAPEEAIAATSAPKVTEAPQGVEDPKAFSRAAIRVIVEREALEANLPADIAEAVIRVESDYDPTAIGKVGEIGLMQVRPGTAAMLGFKGTAEELAQPEVNIHFGVTYLAKAWLLTNGDLCRTLMKYRAGHGEEIMTPLSVQYCNRARSYLAALGSPFATMGTNAPVFPATAPPPAIVSSTIQFATPQAVYGRYKQGTAAASRAFWAVQEARVRAIKARIEAKWRSVASR
jgi:soluble lytic murein transglycosylase-like protein